MTIVILIILIIILYVYLIKFKHPRYKGVLYDEIKDKVKSGDIILFSATDNFNQIPMICYYTHIGVIYRKDADSEPILVESFNTENPTQFFPKEFETGIATCNLEERLKTYRGFVYYKELVKPISEIRNQGFVDFIKYAKENMQYDDNVISNEIHKIILNTPFTTHTNCGQFTELILMKLGLLDMTYFEDRRRHHLRTMSDLSKVKNNFYKTPVYVFSKYFVASEL